MNARHLVMLSICLMTLFIPLSYSGDLNLKKVPIQSLPGWQQDASENFMPAFIQSCQQLMRQKQQRPASTDIRLTPQWQRVCEVAIKMGPRMDNKLAKRFLESWFNAYEIRPANSDRTGLFTGYYEPTYPGSEKRTNYYNIPLYAYPDKTKRMRNAQGETQLHYLANQSYHPIPERASIADGPLLEGIPVIGWVHDKVDRFFMEIQGSGSIITPEGKRILMGYGGQNGQAYFPIGRYLVENGALTKENVSMQSIRAWLLAHPRESDAVMNKNPSFVFFKRLDTKEPIGAQGVPLTPGRSLAVDRKYIPYGTPIFIDTYIPKVKNKQIVPGATLQRLMIAQDTGGAITGPIRGDVFWGHGKQAEWLAGHMQSAGKAWLLLPKGLSNSKIKAF